MDRSKKIIIINSDRRTIAIRVNRIGEILMKNKYDVKILTWDRYNKFDSTEIISDIIVNNYKLKIRSKGNIELIIGYFRWWFFVIRYLLKSEYTIYHPLSLYSVIPTIIAKYIKKTKIIYDITDFAADSLDVPKPIQKIIALIENFCVNYSDAVIIVDSHRKDQINICGVHKLAVVMNSPADIFKEYAPKKPDNRLTIYYGGWLNETRGIIEICKAVQGLKNVKLIIAGFGPYEDNIREIVSKYPNIEFLGPISKEESIKQTYNASAIYAFYNPKIKINRLASPNKVFDAMMCGTAIIANQEALPIAQIINNYNCGILIPYGNINQIRCAIEKLRDCDNIIKMGYNGRTAFLNNFNGEIMANRLITLYSSIDITD